MGLNVSKGNMYEFITHTWNTVKGECFHDCTYCYMKRWGKLKPVHFDEKELKTDLGSGNFIFVVSGGDLFAEDIPTEWIESTLNHCKKFDNKYLFQTKNPFRLHDFKFPAKTVFCTTIETNRWYPEYMHNAPNTQDRAYYMPLGNYVTIEPLMDFDLNEMVTLIKICQPLQVNIGADSGNNHLPEPSKEKLLQLIDELQKFTVIHSKRNLGRILK